MASRWPAILLRKIMSRAISETMMPVFSRISLQLVILSDQGSEFNGKLAKDVSKLLQIKKVHTTAYYPQTNGMIEQFRGTFESMLTKAVDLGLDIGFSSFELVMAKSCEHPLTYSMTIGEMRQNKHLTLVLRFSNWERECKLCGTLL